MEQIFQKVHEEYPWLASGIAVSDGHYLFFDENGLVKIEVLVKQNMGQWYLEAFEYEKKLPKKALYTSNEV